jgi:hypothetical protein
LAGRAVKVFAKKILPLLKTFFQKEKGVEIFFAKPLGLDLESTMALASASQPNFASLFIF